MAIVFVLILFLTVRLAFQPTGGIIGPLEAVLVPAAGIVVHVLVIGEEMTYARARVGGVTQVGDRLVLELTLTRGEIQCGQVLRTMKSELIVTGVSFSKPGPWKRDVRLASVSLRGGLFPEVGDVLESANTDEDPSV